MKAIILENGTQKSQRGSQPDLPFATERRVPVDRAFRVLTPEVVRKVDAMGGPGTWTRADARYLEGLAAQVGCAEVTLLKAFGRHSQGLFGARRQLGIARRDVPRKVDRAGTVIVTVTAAVEAARKTLRDQLKAAKQLDVATQKTPEASAVVAGVRCVIEASLLGQPVTLEISSKDDIARAVKILEAFL